MTRTTTLTLLATTLVAAACGRDGWGPEALTHGEDPTARTLARGRRTYATYCAGCHGDAGDGAGPAARFFAVKPRDLRKGRIKFGSVAAGMPPRDEDLERVITRGLPGSAMPSFALLPEGDRRAVIAYVRSLSDAWKKPPAPAVAIPADPWRKKPADAIALGERVYHGKAQCSGCHPAYVSKEALAAIVTGAGLPFEGARPGMFDSVTKDSEWGAPITPPDFLVNRLRSGATREDLVRTIAAGVGGTAMPSWGNALDAKELWGLAYYVESLARDRGFPEATARRAALLAQESR